MGIQISDLCNSVTMERANRLLKEGTMKKFKISSLNDSRKELSARFVDDFNFVDYARIVVDEEKGFITELECSCLDYTGRNELCCHCAALVKSIPEKESDKVINSEDSQNGKMKGKEATLFSENENNNPGLFSEEKGDVSSPEKREKTASDFCFNFYNSSHDLYPGMVVPKLSKESFELILGKGLLTDSRYEQYCEFGGICYGMTIASGFFDNPESEINVRDFQDEAEKPYDLQLKDVSRMFDISLLIFLEALYVSQINRTVSNWNYQVRQVDLNERLKGLVNEVELYQETGQNLPEMGIYENVRLDNGHSVLPYRYEKISKLKSRLHICDPNWKDEVRYCDLRCDSDGNYISWRYEVGGKMYSSDNGGVISYTPYDIYKQGWDERASNTADKRALFSTKNEDVTVKDESGNTVMKLSAGVMTPMRDDVIPISMKGEMNKTPYFSFWIEQGVYQVTNDDPDTLLVFHYAGDQGLVKVETEASDVLVEINDHQDIQKVLIKDENKSFVVTIRNLEQENVIKGVSEVDTLLMSKENKLYKHALKANCVTQFLINGIEKVPEDYFVEFVKELVEDFVEENDSDEYEENNVLKCTKKEDEKKS